MLLTGRWPAPWGPREIAVLKSSQTRPRVARKIGFCFHKFSLSHLSAVLLKVKPPPPSHPTPIQLPASLKPRGEALDGFLTWLPVHAYLLAEECTG